MIFFSLAFLFGDLYLQTLTELPNPLFPYSLLLIFIFLYILLRKYIRYIYILTAFFMGFAWANWYATSTLSWVLPTAWEGKPLLVSGYINSLPINHLYGTQFEFKVIDINNQPSSTLIRLTASHPLVLKVGDKWQLLVRLKRIHGTQNPGSFDSEAWALQKGLRATGSVLESQDNILLEHRWSDYPISRLRQSLQSEISDALPNIKMLPWITALMIGERSGATQQEWQILRNTGTNHLMVIGGLHIGMIAGFIHLITSWLWRRIPYLALRIPAQQIGAYSALCGALIYGALSGFMIPTQRACIMLTIFIIAISCKRKVNAWHVWSLAMLVVILFNPLTVLTESFWLSFATIALVIYGMHYRINPSGLWWRWGRVQWIIGVGLIPLTLVLFQECSLISFIANTIAIPWLGILILPLCLFADFIFLFSTKAGCLLLMLADKNLSGLWLFLSWLAKFQFSSFHWAVPSLVSLSIMMVGIVLVLMPSGMPGRWIGIIWMMAAIFSKPNQLKAGDILLTLLDVGQGLSVVVQTRTHTLLYDAGPRFDANMDMGERVVVPFLRLSHIKKIDRMVISHADNDHIGGANAVMQAFELSSIKTSAVDKLASLHTSDCYAGEKWRWDGVTFTFLYPYPVVNDATGRNNHSCVLLIDNGKHRILLPGDIEKKAEYEILTHPQSLQADIIVAPHHGSKTSGLLAFIEAVHPQFVLYAVGYRNRYHFPHPHVVSTYEAYGVRAYDTVTSGAVTFKLSQDSTINLPEQYRYSHHKYWFNDRSF